MVLVTIEGETVLVCRQVDDFAVATEKDEIAKSFFAQLRKHVQTEYNAMGIEIPDVGIFERYNGIDIIQTRDYVKVSCESYLDRLFQTHGWDKPPSKASPYMVPLNPTTANDLMKVEGPPEKSPEARALAIKNGFSYRNLLGELIYAFVICRLDIGYAVCFLSRFATAPHPDHYQALRHVCKYLRSTKEWGILYQRPAPMMDLPEVPFEYLPEESDLPPFPVIARDVLVAFLDAAHASDLNTRRSVTGYVIMFCGAAVAYKSRLQPIVATSSTEAEFYAAVTAAKILKFLRYVLIQLESMAPGASPMYIDNEAALAMINESRPTARARHIETQHFAIQEWCKAKDLYMRHIAGIINPSDDLTKPLGWVLHARHARRAMGHYKLVSPETPKALESGRELEPKFSGSATGGTATGNNATKENPLGHVSENEEDNVDNPDVTIQLGGMDDPITIRS